MATYSEDQVFVMPDVDLGDQVLYHSNPLNPNAPVMGWVSRRPGTQTICVLVFSENTGFVEKPSCRHIDDPGLQENPAWREWGAWELHPNTALLRKLKPLLPRLASQLEREKKLPEKP
jgi:hypothetical protein